MAIVFEKVFAIVPAAMLGNAQAAYAMLSETGDPGPVFEACTLNASGLFSDAATHYAACFHIGPEGRAALPMIAEAISGAEYLGPLADISPGQAMAFAAGRGLQVRELHL